MKKVASRMFLILLVALLVLPTSVLAKEVKDAMKSRDHGYENSQWNTQMNAKWSRFEVVLTGENGKGKVVEIKSNNPVFRYEVAGTNEGLENGDSVLIHVINRGGNIVKELHYTIDGLVDVKKPEPIHLHATDHNLPATYGAVRFLNFNNQGSGAEVYLTNAQEKLGTTERTQIDFYRGTTTEDENPYGSWEERNKVRFGYDSDKGKVWVEVDAEYEYRAEYDTVKDADFNTIQFMLLNRQSGSTVKLENVKLNGNTLSDTVLTGDSSWPKWNLEGALQNTKGNFTVQADLVITGDQPQNELNKVEVVFGKK